MKQIILTSDNNYQELYNYLNKNHINNLFIVCSKSIKKFKIYNFLKKQTQIKQTYFDNFQPNPTYESVVEGVKKFNESQSNNILVIGGGSAIDVAKCIKLYNKMDNSINYLEQDIIPNDTNLIAIPTTAGTGSEATKYAVIYYNGEKQSITHESCIPKTILFDSSLLETLPLYQKKATVLDALSHAIESMWSINSTDKSKNYSKKAIKIIMDNLNEYLKGNKQTNEIIFKASNLAGKAINITQTTAGHAMCYKLTSLYNISHGHSAALINSFLFPYMTKNINKCSDERGKEYILNTFNEISKSLGFDSLEEGSNYLHKILTSLDLYNINVNNADIETLTNSVNVTRLKNNPIKLDKKDIKKIYTELFAEIEARKINECKTIYKNIKC